MKILVACEESQRVCKAFRDKGHIAFSCDIEFFAQFLIADCDKIVIENPVGIISGDYIKKWFPELCQEYGLPIKPTQIIQPWMFGDAAQKTTCFWVKGVAPLKPLITEKPELEYFEWVDSKTGRIKRQHMFHYSNRSGKKRSVTFEGVALAMADQWG